MHDDVILDQIAEHQLGLVQRRAALLRGVSVDVMDRRRTGGLLVPLHAGVYRDAAVAPTHEQALLAACLAAGEGAAVCRRAAAALWGLGDDRDADPPIEIVVPAHRAPRLAGVRTYRTTSLPDHHVRRKGLLPVTSVERTLADLGAVVSRWRVADAVERALIDRRTTIPRLYEVLDEIGARGRDGTGVLRTVLRDRLLGDKRPDSMLEPMAARLFHRYGIPPGQFQYEVRDDAGKLVARVDFAWPEHRLVVEVDGMDPHVRRDVRKRDYDRENDLEDLGWKVRRFTWENVVREPAAVARRLRRALGLSPP